MAVLWASLAVLGPSWGSLGPSWSVGKQKTRTPQNLPKNIEKYMTLASRGPLGTPLGGFLERLGGLLARLGVILSILGRFFDDSGPSWTVLVASWGSLGPSWGPLGPQKVTRQAAGSPRGAAPDPRGDAGSPRKIGTRGSEPLNDSSGVRTEAQGRVRGPENTPIRASRHGGGYCWVP